MKLCVKELAAAIGRSAFYVYQMRAKGFPMSWDADRRCQAATVQQAQQWIKATGFRLKAGRGWTQKGHKLTR